MWDYSFIFPSTLMMVTLLAFYFSRPRPPLRLNRAFLYLLVIELLVLLSDVVSTRIDEMYELFSPAVLYVANTAFFMFFTCRIFMFYQFTLVLLYANDTQRPRTLQLVSAVPFIALELLCATSFATGAIFSVQEGAYARGPLYPLLNAAYFLYVLASIALAVTRRSHLRTYDFKCCVAYNLVLLVGTTIRATVPRLLVMDTFCMVAITVIYLGFLNPDLYLSGYGSTFNIRSFRLVLAERLQERDCHLLGFSLQNYNHERSILGSHQMDEAIALIGSFLATSFPHEVTFYLHSGRFVLLGDTQGSAKDLSQQVLARFKKPWRIGAADLRLGISLVQIETPAGTQDTNRIVNNLLIALDNARGGSASIDEWNNSLDIIKIDQQVDTLRLLEGALEQDCVEVFFQPLVSSKTGHIEGAEALARIRDEEGTIVAPGLFIPVAEKSGHIIELGMQVLRRTCEFVSTHDMEALGLNWINVNLSPMQCMQENVVSQFVQTLESYGVSSNMIHLEITEQFLVDYEVLRRQIERLRNAGFLFAMDDYGTGYSNLIYVKRYPFTNIKLDMEVVWDYYRDRDDLLPAIIRGFRSMGLSITAEGIESQEMARALSDIGTDYLQGYYYSKPLPPEEFTQLLQHPA